MRQVPGRFSLLGSEISFCESRESEAESKRIWGLGGAGTYTATLRGWVGCYLEGI